MGVSQNASEEASVAGEMEETAAFNANLGHPLPENGGHYCLLREQARGPLATRGDQLSAEISLPLKFGVSRLTAREEAEEPSPR